MVGLWLVKNNYCGFFFDIQTAIEQIDTLSVHI